MYTVNITFKVDHDIADAWTEWMKVDALPKLSADCDGAACHLHALLGHDDEEGTTFVLQLLLSGEQALNDYQANQQRDLHDAIAVRWGEKCLFFQTVLKRIE